MSKNFETPPALLSELSDPAKTSRVAFGPRRSLISASGEGIVCRLLSDIIRTGRLQVQMPSGRIEAFGDGPPLVAVRLTNATTVWQLLRNPELVLGEAFMDGTLLVEQGSIYDLLQLVMANLKVSRGPRIMRLQANLRRLLRRLVQHNSVAKAQTNSELDGCFDFASGGSVMAASSRNRTL